MECSLQEVEEVPSSCLVPGDVICVPTSGCLMTCDAVLSAGNCLVNESLLTGHATCGCSDYRTEGTRGAYIDSTQRIPRSSKSTSSLLLLPRLFNWCRFPPCGNPFRENTRLSPDRAITVPDGRDTLLSSVRTAPLSEHIL
ncbi:hypothetical protein HPB48_016561 [Haemaphysalis longicornis]|uniref:P-type ATPase A domain-containing protein n=1 Tax=Haemaphysalis longicornis TaxID=44386 RepID=A0A9J6GIJ0_HAELO|nr:hypothetical protein HPB48_016561 [Haemaphysalis longicornis]